VKRFVAPEGCLLNSHKFHHHEAAWYARRLAEPAGPVRLVIDTDAANEIDDQFALTWALLSPERLRLEAVYAAPFSFAHRRESLPHADRDAPPFNPPDVGMRRSRDEILRVFDRLGMPSEGKVYEGSTAYLASTDEPLRSAAAEHLVALARAAPADPPLYVVALGCVTNIASALLLAPDIADKIVVVWTSGYPSHAPHVNDSFNLEQDLIASRVLLDSGVPLVYLPGFHVGAQLRLSLAEADRYLPGRGRIGDYLHGLFTRNPLRSIYPADTTRPYSWVIWDLICVAWLLNPAWVPSVLMPTPMLGDDKRWREAPGRHPMREGYSIDRDAVFNDLFAKLDRHAE
jgi:inosine-uridine nucleoside N-ribohydrolase